VYLIVLFVPMDDGAFDTLATGGVFFRLLASIERLRNVWNVPYNARHASAST
jgi:hypothetical protein